MTKPTTPRPIFCTTCPIGHVTTGYVPPEVNPGATKLLVGEAAGETEAAQSRPFVGGAGGLLNAMLAQSRQKRSEFNIINVIGCRPPNNIFPGDPEWTCTDKTTALAGIEHCRNHHFLPFVSSFLWKKVVVLGGKALTAVTGKYGITTWRGSPLQAVWAKDRPPVVIPTLHPAALMRQSSLFSVCIRDLKKDPANLPAEVYNLYGTARDFDTLTGPYLSFDFEWDKSGKITLVGLSDTPTKCLVASFTPDVIDAMRRLFLRTPNLVGQNIIAADMSYLKELGIDTELHWQQGEVELWDTMLMQHLVQPDMLHGLAFIASVFTSKVHWKGKGEETDDDTETGAQWKTWASPTAIPRQYGGYGGCVNGDEAFRLYNARDTDGTLQAFYPLLSTLEREGMVDIYKHVSVPLSFICAEMSRAGLRIDTKALGEMAKDLTKQIAEKEVTLPPGLAPYTVEVSANVKAPPGTLRPKTKTCKGSRKLSHDPVEVVFSEPGTKPCPTCGKELASGKMSEAKIVKSTRTKFVRPWNSSHAVQEYASSVGCPVKFHAKTKRPTTNAIARKTWAVEHPEFNIVNTLKELGTMRNNFAKDALLVEDRMFFYLNPVGTSEGRLSSSGQRRGIDLNIQNQPKEFRKIFLPDDPEWAWVSSDIVQGENMLTAHLAGDVERLARLNDPTYDEHSDIASEFFQVEVSKKINSHLRPAGKIINHGKNYGLGAKTCQEYMIAEGVFCSVEDIHEMMKIWEKKNARTAEWQRETVALVKQQGFLVNPFGRKRWFQMRDYATKSLAFLPASTLADVVIRCMIAHYPERFHRAISALRIGVCASMVEGWRMAIQVHDSLVSMGPRETWREQMNRTERIMSQPWPELGGFRLGVESEMSYTSWGDCKVVR